MKFAKKTDILIIAAICLLAAGIVLWMSFKQSNAENGAYAEIYYKSELIERIALASAQEESFSLPEAPEVVFRIYDDGSIAFIQSDCPDKVCINSGKLSRGGQFASCLPNEIYIKIVSGTGGNPNDPDIIIG